LTLIRIKPRTEKSFVQLQLIRTRNQNTYNKTFIELNKYYLLGDSHPILYY